MQCAMGTCFERSRQICLQIYEKPLFRDSDYLPVHSRLGMKLTPQQIVVVAALCAWRDRAARDEGGHDAMANG